MCTMRHETYIEKTYVVKRTKVLHQTCAMQNADR